VKTTCLNWWSNSHLTCWHQISSRGKYLNCWHWWSYSHLTCWHQISSRGKYLNCCL